MNMLMGALAILVALGASPGVVVAQDRERARRALSKGDYDTVIKELKPLAEKGDPKAQFQLGDFYNYGIGVEKDYRLAAKYYRMAADQGLAVSQRGLAFLYLKGRGVKEDIVEAYKWYTLAARTSRTSRRMRDGIAGRMTPRQIEQGRARAKAWRAAHPGL